LSLENIGRRECSFSTDAIVSSSPAQTASTGLPSRAGSLKSVTRKSESGAPSITLTLGIGAFVECKLGVHGISYMFIFLDGGKDDGTGERFELPPPLRASYEWSTESRITGPPRTNRSSSGVTTSATA
jgi:hypothetical protein